MKKIYVGIMLLIVICIPITIMAATSNQDGRQLAMAYSAPPTSELFFATDAGIYAMDANGESTERLPLPNLYKFIVWVP